MGRCARVPSAVGAAGVDELALTPARGLRGTAWSGAKVAHFLQMGDAKGYGKGKKGGGGWGAGGKGGPAAGVLAIADDATFLKGCPKLPHWACGKCGDQRNWQSRLACRACGELATHAQQVKARKAQQLAAASQPEVRPWGKPSGAWGNGPPRPWDVDPQVAALLARVKQLEQENAAAAKLRADAVRVTEVVSSPAPGKRPIVEAGIAKASAEYRRACKAMEGVVKQLADARNRVSKLEQEAAEAAGLVADAEDAYNEELRMLASGLIQEEKSKGEQAKHEAKNTIDLSVLLSGGCPAFEAGKLLDIEGLDLDVSDRAYMDDFADKFRKELTELAVSKFGEISKLLEERREAIAEVRARATKRRRADGGDGGNAGAGCSQSGIATQDYRVPASAGPASVVGAPAASATGAAVGPACAASPPAPPGATPGLAAATQPVPSDAGDLSMLDDVLGDGGPEEVGASQVWKEVMGKVRATRSGAVSSLG